MSILFGALIGANAAFCLTGLATGDRDMAWFNGTIAVSAAVAAYAFWGLA